jgi:hypothetical protein
MACHEAAKSVKYNKDGSIDRSWVVYDVQDDTQAIFEALAKSTATYISRPRNPVPDVQNLGYSIWLVTFSYEHLEGEDGGGGGGDTGDISGIVEFDTAGASQHLTQAIQQAVYPTSILDVKNAIGWNGDTVEGVDIVVPQLEITLLKKLPLNYVTGVYVKNLARLTGKTNLVPYTIGSEQFDAGELLFRGAQGTVANSQWDLRCSMSASENRTSFTVGTITVNSKGGHDYLSVKYKKEEETAGGQTNIVPKPEFVFVSKVYEQADFRAVLGF